MNNYRVITDFTTEDVIAIKRIERKAYENNRGLMQLQDCETDEDIKDYCETDDVTCLMGDNFYLMVGEHDDHYEVVDLAKESGLVNIHKVVAFLQSMDKDKPFTFDARENTSYKIIKALSKAGRCEIEKDTTYTWCGETFHDIKAYFGKEKQRTNEAEREDDYEREE